MVNRLTGKVALITGSSSGIGRAIALLYAEEGAKVICADLDTNAREGSGGGSSVPTHDLIGVQGGNAMFKKVDVMKEAEVEDAVAFAVEVYGRLDILVNNAGACPELKHTTTKPGGQRIHECSTADFDLTFAINTRGPYLACKYALRQFLNQEPWPANSRGERTRGWIVNIASAAGLKAFQGIGAYTASKHAVMGLTKEIAISYAEDRIHCNAICPGIISTALSSPLLSSSLDDTGNPVAVAAHPWKSVGMPEDVAKGALFLASEDAQWITGTGLSIDGGFTA